MRLVVVPLAHDLFGVRVVQRGKGLIRELAHQVFCAVDFKRVELGVFVCFHGFVVAVVAVVVVVVVVAVEMKSIFIFNT
jgi:hypothetical protein